MRVHGVTRAARVQFPLYRATVRHTKHNQSSIYIQTFTNPGPSAALPSPQGAHRQARHSPTRRMCPQDRARGGTRQHDKTSTDSTRQRQTTAALERGAASTEQRQYRHRAASAVQDTQVHVRWHGSGIRQTQLRIQQTQLRIQRSSWPRIGRRSGGSIEASRLAPGRVVGTDGNCGGAPCGICGGGGGGGCMADAIEPC